MTAAARRIVVGTDGSRGARSAVEWAADEAALRQDELLIVYAPHVDARIVAKVGDALLRAVDEFGEQLLQDAAAEAVDRQPSLTVETELRQGAPAEVLVELGAHADLVVVGSRGSDEATGTLIGSVSHRVATHAGCPVAIVPADLTAAPAGVIVAGVTDSSAGLQAARVAAAEAALRGAPLRLIHGCKEPAGVEPSRPDLDQVAAAIRSAHPTLTVDMELAPDDAVGVLFEAARGAQLLVLGCHRSTDRWSTRLGPVPSQLIHRVACPVLLAGS